MLKFNNPIPDSPEEWLKEITKAYVDAKETIPISGMTGIGMTDDDLFQLAPSVCFKFRGIIRSRKILKQATDAALSRYLAIDNINKGMLSNPILAFAFCYLCSHYGLDIIDENQFNEIMEYIETEEYRINSMIDLFD